jgi:hypothetical protein
MKTEVTIQKEPATEAGGYIRRGACVLVPVSFCACALGIRNDEVAERVESGQIRWAFDMAQPGARARCLRVWVQSLDRYRAGLPDPKELTEEAVISDVLGTRLHRIRASNLGVRWNLSRQFFWRLLHAGEVSGELEGHSIFLNRESLVRWLHRRGIGPRTDRSVTPWAMRYGRPPTRAMRIGAAQQQTAP